MGEVLQAWEERDKKILVGMEGNREKGTWMEGGGRENDGRSLTEMWGRDRQRNAEGRETAREGMGRSLTYRWGKKER